MTTGTALTAELVPKHMSTETKILEQTLNRIGELLNIGFGEAGSLIIANSIKSGGAVDTTAAGTRVTGAFGFCDIRQFTDATECLQVCPPFPSRLRRRASYY